MGFALSSSWLERDLCRIELPKIEFRVRNKTNVDNVKTISSQNPHPKTVFKTYTTESTRHSKKPEYTNNAFFRRGTADNMEQTEAHHLNESFYNDLIHKHDT